MLSIIIEKCSPIEALSLKLCSGENQITDKSLEYLGAALKKSIHVFNKLHLDLSQGKNSVTNKGISKLAESIATCTRIEVLRLEFSDGGH